MDKCKNNAANSIDFLGRQMNRMTPENPSFPANSSLGRNHNSAFCLEHKLEFSSWAVFKFVIFVLSGLYIPIIFLWLGIIPFEYRFYVSFFVIVSFLLFALQRKYRFRELGYRVDNFASSLCWNAIFCVLGSLSLYYASKYGLLNPVKSYDIPYVYIFYVVFLAPVQELLFRGVIFAEMRRIGNIDFRVVLLVSTFSFCFLHIIYNRPLLLIVSLVSGLIWGVIYIKWPNIWGVSLSHALLGIVAMFLGVF